MKTGFEIPRQIDKEVWCHISDAIGNDSFGRRNFSTILGVEFTTPEEDGLDKLFKLDTYALLRIRVDLADGTSIRFSRPTTGDQVVTGLLDNVSIEASEKNASTRPLEIIRDLRKSLGAVDERTHLSYLSEGDRLLAEKRDQVLNTLSETQELFSFNEYRNSQ